MGNIIDPLEPAMLSTNDDGITIEAAISMTMAWTSFLYSEDVSVKVSRLDGSSTAASNVTIRPTTLDYAKTEVNGDLYITVPYNSRGVRFSLEFTDNLYEFHSNCAISSTVGKQNLAWFFPSLDTMSSLKTPLAQSSHPDWSQHSRCYIVLEENSNLRNV